MFICDISIFNRYGKQLLDEGLKDLALDWRELVVVLVLAEVPAISQTRLSPFLQTDKANVTKILKVMEEKGLIHRSADEADQRNKICRLTAEAQDLLPELKRIMAQWEAHCFQGLSREELAEFQRLSEKITRNLLDQGL